jgi:hypothetical protein
VSGDEGGGEGGGSLPFTGLFLIPLALIGAGLVTTGRQLRGRRRGADHRGEAKPRSAETPPKPHGQAASAMADLKPGQKLPAWFVARSLLAAVRELGSTPTQREYTSWRDERAAEDEHAPPSARVIAQRFGGWRKALEAAAEATDATDGARRLTRALHEAEDSRGP